jgi:hypothetical protein
MNETGIRLLYRNFVSDVWRITLFNSVPHFGQVMQVSLKASLKEMLLLKPTASTR